MFRKFGKTLREAGLSRTKRPRREYRPSMGQSLTKSLENRRLLSGLQAENHLLASLGVGLHGTAKAFVDSLYTNIAHQTPSQQNVAPWLNRLRHGWSREQVAQAFIAASTSKSPTPSPTDSPEVKSGATQGLELDLAYADAHSNTDANADANADANPRRLLFL